MKSPIVTAQEAAQLLLAGKVGVMPSDTVYGIVACAHLPETVAYFYQLKERDHKPGTVIAASVQQLIELGLPKKYLHAVEPYWPNPLTFIIDAPDSLDYLTMDVKSLACRIPANENIRALLEITGPLVTSSANLPGQPTAETIDEAQAYFGDKVAFYVDGGRISGALPSTIVKLGDGKLEIIRQGAYHF